MAVPVNKWRDQPEFDCAIGMVMVIDLEGNIIAQHRDGNTRKSPNMASTFGGALEVTDESPRAGAARELAEETNLKVRAEDLEHFKTYDFFINGVHERLFTFITYGHSTDGLEVYEGQGYHVVTNPDDPLIAPVVQELFAEWFAKKALDSRYRSA